MDQVGTVTSIDQVVRKEIHARIFQNSPVAQEEVSHQDQVDLEVLETEEGINVLEVALKKINYTFCVVDFFN